jgi:hypothetical protein
MSFPTCAAEKVAAAAKAIGCRPDGGRVLGFLALLLSTLALAGCGSPPRAAEPPPDPPSGEIRPDTLIPYETLVEHMHFNTKSHMKLFFLRGRVIQVHGPVWQVDVGESGATLWLGTVQGSEVRAEFSVAEALRDVRKGQEVDVVGTFEFRGAEVILDNASLKKY